MRAVRSSPRIMASGSPKEDMIVIIKTPEDGGPAEKIADVKASIIQHMCNKCNKKYTTSLGLKRHLKICNNAPDDILLQMPIAKNFAAENVSENHNDVNSKNYNLISDPSDIYNDNMETEVVVEAEKPNPYDFDEEGHASDAEITTESLIAKKADLCLCCGEDKKTAHSAGEFKCELCNKYYKYKKSLARHQFKFHSTSENAISCEMCNVTCVNEQAHFEHMQIHSPIRMFDCKFCDKTFTRQYHLDRHLVQTGCDGREKASFPCKVCGNILSRKDNLREHLRNHIGKSLSKKVYKCDICDKEFKGKTMMTVHVRTHTGETPYKCSSCPKGFKSKGALIKHERCHTGEKPYSCSQCNKSFAAKETLNRHVKTHLENKPHVCLECGKTFIQISQLRAHMFYHTGLNGFKCKYCDMIFNRKLRLTIHEQFVHEGAKKMDCPTEGCNKSFMRKDDLTRHLTTHTDFKPFSCDECEKKFRTRPLLRAHARTHQREIARSCAICPRAFIRADCLLRHMRAKHPEQHNAALKEARSHKIQTMKARLKNRQRLAEGVNLNNCEEETTIIIEEQSQNSSQNEQEFILDEQQEGQLEIEVVNIPLSVEYLTRSIEELLTLLIDKQSLEINDWCNLTIDKLLEEVILKCGHTPSTIEDRGQRLRKNVELLLSVVIDDSTMKRLIASQTIDEVILYVLRLGKIN